jgi:hypothetical protein
MQFVLAEQQRKDWERIKFRQEEYDRKRQEFHERQQNEELEQHQREERLQALADRVRPHIETDYARILQPTQVNLFFSSSKTLFLLFRLTTLIVVYYLI